MAAKKSTKTGIWGGEDFSGWPEYIPLTDHKLICRDPVNQSPIV